MAAGIVSRRGIIAGPMNKENHQAKRPSTSPAVREDEVPVTKPSATESSRAGLLFRVEHIQEMDGNFVLGQVAIIVADVRACGKLRQLTLNLPQRLELPDVEHRTRRRIKVADVAWGVAKFWMPLHKRPRETPCLVAKVSILPPPQ